MTHVAEPVGVGADVGGPHRRATGRLPWLEHDIVVALLHCGKASAVLWTVKYERMLVRRWAIPPA